MVDWLIFSKDRACQLDGLLRSHSELAGHVTRSITVLYMGTTNQHAEAYAKCQQRWGSIVLFRREADKGNEHMANDFEGFVHAFVAGIDPQGTIGFLCDDDLWRRHPKISSLPFSVRLGANCVRQHPTGLEQRQPRLERSPVDTLRRWRWQGADGDFGYPFSLDGDVRGALQMCELVQSCRFDSPTSLEAGVVAQVVERPELAGAYMHSGVRSSLLSIPANRVTAGSNNPVMADGRSADEMCRLYLDGATIDPLRTLDAGPTIDAAHVEMQYVLTGGGAPS